MLQLEQHSNG